MTRTKADWEQTRNEIVRLYCSENQPITRIAERFGLTRQAVYSRLVTAGVETWPRKYTPRQLSREDLARLYVDNQMPISHVARLLKSTHKMVVRELERYGIERRKVNRRKRVPSELDGLNVGDSCTIHCRPCSQEYAKIYSIATIRNMRVSVRKLGSDQVRATRVE